MKHFGNLLSGVKGRGGVGKSGDGVGEGRTVATGILLVSIIIIRPECAFYETSLYSIAGGQFVFHVV